MAIQNKPILITFNKGIQQPAKLGKATPTFAMVPVLRPTSEGYMTFAQNIDLANDIYGESVVPGPMVDYMPVADTVLTARAARSLRSFVSPTTTSSFGYLYYGVGDNDIRRIANLLSTFGDPVSDPLVLTFTGAGTGSYVSDIQLRQVAGSALPVVYVSTISSTQGIIKKFTGDLLAPVITDIATSADADAANLRSAQLALGSDGNLYWGYGSKISAIDIADAFTANKLANGLPGGYGVTALMDWQAQLLIAYHTVKPYDFDLRTLMGKSGILIWDYVSPSFIRNVPAPCRYISAMVNDPEGNLLVFGGVDAGRSGIYIFNGFGFRLLTSYIGDLPMARHSIDFDSEGRLIWVTANGRICRYDKRIDRFEYWSTLTPTLDSFTPDLGGMLARGYRQTSATGLRFDFFASTAQTAIAGPVRIVRTDKFISDGQPVVETSSTPKAISGVQVLPNHSTISACTLNLARELQVNEKIILQVYVNGNLTPIVYDNLDFAIDGPVSSKRKSLTLNNVNNFAIGLLFKGISQLTTAPAVLNVVVEYT